MFTSFPGHRLVLFVRLLMTRDGMQCDVLMKINKKASVPEEHQFCSEIRLTYMTSQQKG